MSAAQAQRAPCADQDLEARYLGSLLVDPDAIERHRLPPRALTRRDHRALLEVLQALAGQGDATDVVSVALELERRGLALGGEPWLRRLTSVVELYPGPLADRLRELHAAREARERALRGVVLLEGGELSEGLRLLRDAGEIQHPDELRAERYGTVGSAVRKAIDELRERAEVERPPYVATGIQGIDDVIVGVEYGDLTVVGGDTSAGKSSVAMHMAIAMARAGHRPGIISCEDAERRVGRRVLSMLSGVPAAVLRRAKGLTDWHLQNVRGAQVQADGLTIELAYCVGETLEHVIDACRVLLRDRGCNVLFLDYVQAVDCPGQDERIAMKSVLNAFKRECNRVRPAAAAFALSQLKRREKIHERPRRSDLYESGYLEQKADSILLIWQDADKITRLALDKAKDDGTGQEVAFRRDGGRLIEMPQGAAQQRAFGGGKSAAKSAPPHDDAPMPEDERGW